MDDIEFLKGVEGFLPVLDEYVDGYDEGIHDQTDSSLEMLDKFLAGLGSFLGLVHVVVEEWEK